MIATGYNGYKSTIVNTTRNKEEILLLLYEKALFCLKAAARGIEEGSARKRGENISRVLAILTEFECALDRERGGSIADSLAGLYAYCTSRLTAANLRNDVDAVREVEAILTGLFEGFKDAARTVAHTGALHQAETAVAAGGGMRIAV